jgi:hypothetical protein
MRRGLLRVVHPEVLRHAHVDLDEVVLARDGVPLELRRGEPDVVQGVQEPAGQRHGLRDGGGLDERPDPVVVVPDVAPASFQGIRPVRGAETDHPLEGRGGPRDLLRDQHVHPGAERGVQVRTHGMRVRQQPRGEVARPPADVPQDGRGDAWCGRHGQFDQAVAATTDDAEGAGHADARLLRDTPHGVFLHQEQVRAVRGLEAP